MEKVFKNVNLLYVICNDSILMRKFSHQGYDVLDVFAFKSNDNVDTDLKNKLMSLFGKTFPYSYYGTIESVIHKEGIIAHLTIKTYKILLDQKYDVLANYADDVINSGNGTLWVKKSDIKNEKRLREGDKKILERVFDDKNIIIKIVENQGERWIDAKTISFEDK
jgi:hypothetical protein